MYLYEKIFMYVIFPIICIGVFLALVLILASYAYGGDTTQSYTLADESDMNYLEQPDPKDGYDKWILNEGELLKKEDQWLLQMPK